MKASIPQEIEAKFYVTNLNNIETRLLQMKARLIQARTRELNLRFDTSARTLTQQGCVLRLRLDNEARLTYKGSGKKENGIASREEIEFVVQDFKLAQQFLESLGYEKIVSYEKLRTIYELGRTHIMLDKMPYGSFVEIEGKSEKAIRTTAEKIGLHFDAAVATSYLGLFKHVCTAKKLKFADLTFKNFKGMRVSEKDLGVKNAL